MRGVETRQEVNPAQLLRDTRTLSQRIYDFFQDRTNISILLVVLACGGVLVPSLTDLCLVIGIGCFCYTYRSKQKLPFRLPKCSLTKDYNDTLPGSLTPNLARGIAFFGNDLQTKEELWFHNEDLRTHVLIFGSTGSGKTEALISFAYNSLLHGSGFIYVDGKGDNSLYAKIFSMVRSVGREDDLLLINFMTGARDIVGPQEKRLSNTLNPFATGSSSMLTQLVVSMMDSSSQASDGDMWKGRAISFVEALMKILVYMRDEDAILLDANTVRNYFHLPRLESIVIDKKFPRDNEEPYNLNKLPEVVMEPIKNYLYNLPGYNPEKKGKQVSQVLEQHGFITMQLTRVFTSLADTYGHILRTKLAEVDFKDVVLNRRILVVLLPALEKSPDELSNLGKVIVASLKAMMASGLGEEVEGDYDAIITRKATNSQSPYMCILDEYGYYAVEGFSVVPAQARSLGFSTIFAGQDLPAFQKASKEEAASIGANTNIKICMKLEDPTETWDFFTKTAGEAYVTKVDAFQTKDTSISNSYLDTKSSSFEKRARVDLLDLKDQRPGEAHIFHASKIVRADLFYASPPRIAKLRLNQFIKVDSPSDKTIEGINTRIQSFENVLQKGDIEIDYHDNNEDIKLVSEIFRKTEGDNLIQKSMQVLEAYVGHTENQLDDNPFHEEVEDTLDFSIFSPLQIKQDLQPLLATHVDEFSKPLIKKENIQGQLTIIEKFTGKSNSQAHMLALEIVKDIKSGTTYPPSVFADLPTSELARKINTCVENIQNMVDTN